MQQHHVQMLGMDPVEACPDQVVVVEVSTACDGHLGALGQKQLRFGPASGGKKIPAIDHRCGQVAMADARAAPGMPGLGKMMLETIGGEVAEKFQCCAAFEHALSFGH